jgi:hypothetical protein
VDAACYLYLVDADSLYSLLPIRLPMWAGAGAASHISQYIQPADRRRCREYIEEKARGGEGHKKRGGKMREQRER